MAKPPADPPPSMNDILTAVAALRPAPVEEKGFAKFGFPVVIALVIGLLGWAGASLSSLSTAVATMAANLTTVQKSVDELNTRTAGITDKIADLQSRLAQHDLRLNAVETEDLRMKERIRIAEGQKPIKAGEPAQ